MRQLLVVLLLSGCTAMHATGEGPDAGGGGSGGPDGGLDGGDAGGSDGGLSPDDVQVVVQDGFTPIANVRVVFEAPDGTRTERATDASGVASAALPDGGHVTVIRTYPVAVAPAPQHYPEIFDYLEVEPGEVLHVGHAVDQTTPPTPITVHVPNVAQGAVEVVTACGTGEGTAPTIVVPVTRCPPMTTFYVEDATGWGFVATAPYAADLDFTSEYLYEPLSTTLLTYDLTPDLASITAEARAMDGTHALYATGAHRVDQQPVQLGLPNLAGKIDELVLGTREATAGGTQVVATRTLWEPMPVSVDASGAVLPYLRQPATFSPTTITWAEDGTGAPDAILATFEVTRGDPDVAPAEARYRRTIIAPHDGTSLAIPQLAGADATYNPGTSDQLAGAVGLVGSTAGYDGLVPWAFGVSSITDVTATGDTLTLSYASGAPPTL